MTLKSLLLPLLVGGLLGACASDDARPTTLRELSQQVGAIKCAYDLREDACAGRALDDAAACQAEYVTESCWIAEHGRFDDVDTQDPGACDRPLPDDVARTVPTFEQYDACLNAVTDLSCSAVDAKTKPAACDNVVK